MVRSFDIFRRSKVLAICLFLNACYLTNMVAEAQSRGGSSKNTNKKTSARGKKTGVSGNVKKSGAGYSTGVYICLIALLLCFIPAILVFVYNLYKDPMTPQLLVRLMEAIKDNLTMQLSKRTNSNSKASTSKKNDSASNSSAIGSNTININMDQPEPESFFMPMKPKRN